MDAIATNRMPIQLWTRVNLTGGIVNYSAALAMHSCSLALALLKSQRRYERPIALDSAVMHVCVVLFSLAVSNANRIAMGTNKFWMEEEDGARTDPH